MTFFFALFTLVACSDPEQPAGATADAPPPLEQQSQAAVAEARALYNQSVELGFAWTAARLQLAAAEQALTEAKTEADHKAALEHALEAKLIAQASLTQAKNEAGAWRTRAPF